MMPSTPDKDLPVVESRPGPLYQERFDLVAALKQIPIQTGDIFFRRGKESFFGVPFSKLVAKLTGSRYSHASVAYVQGNQIFLVEVAEMGTHLLRLIDWLDFCDDNGFSVHRPLFPVPEISTVIQKFIDEDPDYNFNFNADSSTYYCTQSVAWMYEEACYPLGTQAYLCDVIKGRFSFWLFRVLNRLSKLLTGSSFPLNAPVHFAGNTVQGLISSHNLRELYSLRP